jgi:pyridoxamine 5'-phosphate oxidase
MVRLTNSKTVYQLATLDANNSVPEVRSVVHRDVLYTESKIPLFLITTDIRTPKANQIDKNPNVHISWWIEGTQEQFRITGTASIVPDPTKQAKPIAGTLATLAEEGLDWEVKRKEVFNSMTPHMRASWCRAVPGTPMAGGYEEAKKWPETLPKLNEAKTDEEKKNQEFALSNFALVLIEPWAVDWVELGVIPNQRTNFTRKGDQWVEQIVVP